MPECDNCGAHVSRRFTQVFADDQGRLFACPECAAQAGVAQVALERRWQQGT